MHRSESSTIKYKIINGKDIITLYKLLLEIANQQNMINYEKDIALYGDKINKRSKEYNLTPTFTFKDLKGTTYTGTTLDELIKFVSERKIRIEELSIYLFFDYNTNIRIVLCSDNTRKHYSNYTISGENDWLLTVQSRISDIFQNTNSIPMLAKFYHKFQLPIFLSITFILHILFGNLYIASLNQFSEPVALFVSILQLISFSIITLTIIEKSVYSIEFKLNDDYIDTPSRNRKIMTFIVASISFIIGIISFLR